MVAKKNVATASTVGRAITTEEKIKAFSRIPRLQAYDITATFGDGSIGRTKRRLTSEAGATHLDEYAWQAGEIAYQCLKQLYSTGITHKEYCDIAKDFYSMVCEDVYPEILKLAESGRLIVKPNGIDGLKEAWDEYGWCSRIMLAFNFIDGLNAAFTNPLNAAVPLALLKRLDDAVIAECMNEDGLAEAMIEVTRLQDRLQPPRHVEAAIQSLERKIEDFVQARRKGANALHAENRLIKAEVFAWLDSQPPFRFIETAATAIIKQQPIQHSTARKWFKEWKKLQSASTP